MAILKLTSFLFCTSAVLLLEGCSSATTSNGGKQIDNVETALRSVRERMSKAEQTRSDNLRNVHPTLVAVSTAQSVDQILQAYRAGQRNFGESNVDELFSKATNSKTRKNCREIKWHFIGRLANEQLLKLVSVPNLYIIETIDSRRMASAVERAAAKKGVKKQIRVFAQVNPNKSEPTAFVKHVIDECPHLKFSGMMVLGKNDYDKTNGPNPEFLKLIEFKKAVCSNLKLKPTDVQLSMGMTKDFEEAIAIGSDNVRVGTAIFGERKQKA